MRLFKQLVEKNLNKYLSSQNSKKKLNIYAFYKAYQISCVCMNEKMQDKEMVNKLWKVYNLEYDKYKDKIEQFMNSKIMEKDLEVVNRFLNEAPKQMKEEKPETNFNYKGVIGVASYFVEGDEDEE